MNKGHVQPTQLNARTCEALGPRLAQSRRSLIIRPAPFFWAWQVASAVGLKRVAEWFWKRVYITSQNRTWAV